MPIKAHLSQGASATGWPQVMGEAFERSLAALRLRDRSDPLVEVVARKVRELVREGQSDPATITRHIIAEFTPRTPAEKQALKAREAADSARAMADYRAEEQATRDRTARLRSERLAREAAGPSPKVPSQKRPRDR